VNGAGEVRDELGASDEEEEVYYACDAVEYPDQGDGPAEGGVGADGAPAQEQVELRWLTGDEGRKEEKEGGGDVIEELEDDDLSEDA